MVESRRIASVADATPRWDSRGGTTMKASFRSVLLGLCTLTGLGACVATPSMAADANKYKVFVTIGFDGNTWMTAATNLISAMSKTKDYKDRVASLTIQSARGDAQTQVQQINAAVE